METPDYTDLAAQANLAGRKSSFTLAVLQALMGTDDDGRRAENRPQPAGEPGDHKAPKHNSRTRREHQKTTRKARQQKAAQQARQRSAKQARRRKVGRK